ncbi:hypothetical protein NHX12_030757 [Muraenolepis orangiensis]|uniref:RanBP-type and C3HC4-type zinc finger-containing protein 1 n=1 Tax=Muraenolepis orangiensis TaxID=630683 RepID=A0A9Q0IM60_9TELE|nr:hypothetical protein NHX12_030757 [Muraenolepis orangiensis]
MTSESVNKVKEAEQLALALGEAICNGEKDEAARLSRRLSELAVPVTVNVDTRAYPSDSIKLKVGVEDGLSDIDIPVTVEVSTRMTIAQLKEKFSHDYGFDVTLQRWVIGKRLARDGETLSSHGVQQSGDQAFLFILSTQAAAQQGRHLQLREQRRLDGIAEQVHLIPRGLGAVTPRPKTPFKPPVPPKPKKVEVGWTCAICTFVNKPTRPGCEICSGERPQGYRVPENYERDVEEVQWMLQENEATQLYEERERNFQELMETEDQSIIPCNEGMDCPICFSAMQPGEGATLRECLHSFCRECLKATIEYSQDAEVSCPFRDNQYTCDKKMQDREIQALLTDEEHQRFLQQRLSIAETRMKNSFHCQTANCQGWCVYEDEAIHKDMDCKQYQDDLRIKAENDHAAKRTKDMLEAMLQSGEAMKCPSCDVTMQKKSGCDWICCVMCKTEICWVTKQARWGPKGAGDTSGGCKCRVNNVLCHPNCQNCH